MSMMLMLPLLLFAESGALFGVPQGTKSTGPGWMETLGNWFGNLLLSIASAFTWAGGKLFDFAFQQLVLGMGDFIKNDTSIGQSINTSWTVIRDFANLAFIFGLIYIGLRTIFDYENANTRRMLVTLIIAALLINFSLFFTKLVVDVSNFLATQMYTQALGEGQSISILIGQQMGIVSLFDAPDPKTFANLTTAGNVWFFFLGALVLLIAAFVLAAGGILLIVRFVGLILLMIFSPVFFAALVFPKTQDAARQLFSKLIEYAFFAPVFLLLLLISLNVLQATRQSFVFTGDTFTKALTNEIDSYGVIANFAIVAIFMVFSLLAAQKMSIYGGSSIVSLGNTMARGAGRYAARGALWLPRKGGEVGLRAGSRWARRAELSPKGMWLKRLPFVTRGLQTAGRYSQTNLNAEIDKLEGLRTKQLHNLLDTYMSQISGSEDMPEILARDTLAVYERILKNGDLDELEPEQIQHFLKLRKRFGLGSKSIHVERPDAVGAGMEDAIGRFKFASDVTKLHRVVFREEGQGTGVTAKRGTPEYEKQLAERREQLKTMGDLFLRNINSEVLAAFIRRRGEPAQRVIGALRENMETDEEFLAKIGGSGKLNTKDATQVSRYFEHLAEVEAAKENPDLNYIKQNEDKAEWVRTATAIRAMGLDYPKKEDSEGDGMDEDAEDFAQTIAELEEEEKT